MVVESEMRRILLAMYVEYNGCQSKMLTAIAMKIPYTPNEVRNALSKLTYGEDGYYTIIDEDYPKELKQMYNPPIVIPKGIVENGVVEEVIRAWIQVNELGG